MNKINLFMIFCLIICNACDDEDKLHPTEGLEKTYSLPQGNHDYDIKIVEWNKRCGFYILYDFQPKDIYWGQTKWEEAIEVDGIWSSGILGEPADPTFVGEQLEFLENHLFKYYPDSTLRHFMPLKFLLCKSLQYVNVLPEPVKEDITLFSSIDMIAMNYGNERINQLDMREKKLLRDTLNVELLWRAIDVQKIKIDHDFLQLSEYGQSVTPDNMYASGFINGMYDYANQEKDFKYFIQAIVTTPYAVLTAEPEDDDFSYRGILHPKKDVNNLVLQKYTILINYFKLNHGVDLQLIGNDLN